MTMVSSSRSRRVLLITTGATPQVVTETVHALATGDPAWVPDRILLATTADGAALFEHGRHDAYGAVLQAPLLGPAGKLFALSDALRLGIRPDQISVIVPKDHSGQPCLDIHHEEQVAAFAESLMQTVAGVTADPDSELHVSLAGGRKTMSFLAGQVMSLLGRSQDDLSHVLVEPASLESPASGFWWPGDGSAGSELAVVRLHRVPFLRVRAWLQPEQMELMKGGGFSAAVGMANIALGSAPVVIDLATRSLRVGEKALRLNPRELALLSLLALARMRGQTTGLGHADAHDGAQVQCMLLDGARQPASALWAWLCGAASLSEIHADSIMTGFQRFDQFVAAQQRELDSGRYAELIGQVLSRLRTKLGRALPSAMARRIILPGRMLATGLEPASIRILLPDDLSSHPAWPPEADPASTSV